ncbi:MAG TPA: agmatinase [Methanocorpusculum sp.]|nr:agmatinase [Methanocorpusculum sp.]
MQSFSSTLFADADSEYTSARYVLFGVPFDGTTSFKAGCRDGPAAIRAASYNLESYFPHYDLEMYEIPMHDMGDLYCECLPDLMAGQVEDTVRDIVADGKIPVMFGGEHSATIGAVKAVKPAWYIVCDAHLDSQDEYRGSRFNHDCVTARNKETVGNIIFLGARSGTKEEFTFAREHARLYTADDIRDRGIAAVMDEIMQMVGSASVYLSIDADAIDCGITPGLGTPEPFGMTPLDIRTVIRRLAPQTVGFDYVEVMPTDQGQTAMVAAHLVREFIAGNFCGNPSQ